MLNKYKQFTSPPNQNDIAECEHCHWVGAFWQVDLRNVFHGDLLSIRVGESYHCPECGEKLGEYIWRIS